LQIERTSEFPFLVRVKAIARIVPNSFGHELRSRVIARATQCGLNKRIRIAFGRFRPGNRIDQSNSHDVLNGKDVAGNRRNFFSFAAPKMQLRSEVRDAFCQRDCRPVMLESYLMVTPPDWLSTFVDSVTAHIHSHDVLSPLGCHFQQVDDLWEITVFASRTEVVGGPQDGLLCNAAFSVDVNRLLNQFSEIHSISWQAHSLGMRDELGPHLSVEGRRDNRQLWLRITSTAPERFEAGRRAIVNQQQIEEIW
jgi:hypothetical protein